MEAIVERKRFSNINGYGTNGLDTQNKIFVTMCRIKDTENEIIKNQLPQNFTTLSAIFCPNDKSFSKLFSILLEMASTTFFIESIILFFN